MSFSLSTVKLKLAAPDDVLSSVPDHHHLTRGGTNRERIELPRDVLRSRDDGRFGRPSHEQDVGDEEPVVHSSDWPSCNGPSASSAWSIPACHAFRMS